MRRSVQTLSVFARRWPPSGRNRFAAGLRLLGITGISHRPKRCARPLRSVPGRCRAAGPAHPRRPPPGPSRGAAGLTCCCSTVTRWPMGTACCTPMQSLRSGWPVSARPSSAEAATASAWPTCWAARHQVPDDSCLIGRPIPMTLSNTPNRRQLLTCPSRPMRANRPTLATRANRPDLPSRRLALQHGLAPAAASTLPLLPLRARAQRQHQNRRRPHRRGGFRDDFHCQGRGVFQQTRPGRRAQVHPVELHPPRRDPGCPPPCPTASPT